MSRHCVPVKGLLKGFGCVAALFAVSACNHHRDSGYSFQQSAPYTAVETRSIPSPANAPETEAIEEIDHSTTGSFTTMDHRSIRTIAMDQDIVTGIKTRLEKEPTVEPSKILIYSYNGVVRLMGTTVDNDAAQRVIEIAAETPHVNKVIAEHLRVTHVGITLASRTF